MENDWYDGPRSGLASIGGLPHYFESVDGYANPEAEDEEFLVWPAEQLTLDLEREQWGIFCAWIACYEAGEAAPDTHPGGGGISERYDELQELLAPRRQAPADASRFVPEWGHYDRSGSRYLPEGPAYMARWRPA
ncbi:hypothetical protein [Streptomyces sp. 3212.3]|uniref:hypothetical protein n=1 Tax=Streptomyces sp. 3212.3 TaxID=1938846 RepID=UPI002B417571|nr:hypothetical protein [Streptomyces sp. 3212.3]